MGNESLSPDNFGGVARLFPIPNLVCFPHVIQPLHIFEPRYQQLMHDALAEDRLITMAVLQPGWERMYHKNPAIYPIVTIGRIHQEQQLEDGRWNLLWEGLNRARVVKEISTDYLYRVAEVELLQDIPLPSPERDKSMRQYLDTCLCQRFGDEPLSLTQFRQLLAMPTSLGTLCDILGFVLPLPFEQKNLILEELDCERRAHLLLGMLNVPTPLKKWPREFSSN